MERAVSAAWQEPYKHTGNMLERVLSVYMKDTSNHYARDASITQSSGTGKSRMVDELAKQIFCIPMSLGSKSAYPPQDIEVVRYFQSSMSGNAGMRAQRIQLFMCALFEIALARVKVIASEYDSEDKSLSGLASRFRQLMSDGMEYGQHGQYREEFYSDVCKRATEVSCISAQLLSSRSGITHTPGQGSPTPVVSVEDQKATPITVTTAAQVLTSYLAKIPIKSSAGANTQLDLILHFDEAQCNGRDALVGVSYDFLFRTSPALTNLRLFPSFLL
ncbi:hypothetical protein NUW54_g12977 [Trametes sanguinea]|uniref:Uncharacterized protein n=1 Tax=Trametes sanguinea TaxID=158606 RepID=A0ACC1MQU5_9APHY|nr:hypothetical protein NUW54_g12977 [Trametes sanguinea]